MERDTRGLSGLSALFERLTDDAAAILDERTRALAAALDTVTSGVDEHQYLTFVRGTLRIALPTSAVVRLYRAPKLTRIPCAPESVARVMHVDGRIVSVVDPLEILARGSGHAAAGSVLLLEHQRVFLGVMVDRVLGLESILDSRIKRGADVEAGAARLVVGTGPGMSVVLDPETLVMSTRLTSVSP